MPLNAPERNRERAPASTPLPETSTTTSSSWSSWERLATMKSPAKEVPPADLATDSTNQSGGRSGRLPCWEIRSRRSMNIDSPRGPETPSRLLLKEVIMISNAMAKVTTTRPMLRRLIVGWSRSSRQKQAQTNTMNHGSVLGPSHRLPMNIGSSITVDGTKSGKTSAPSVHRTVKTTSVITAGRSETDISRRRRRVQPLQGRP